MSTQHPSDFIGSLVEMAKAYEELPKVQAELTQAYKQNTADLETIQRLELKLLDRANEIAGLQSSVRSLEVERDDAQFHSLEADDRTARALDFIKATFGNAGSLIQALEPAKAVEPQPEPTVTNEEGRFPPEGLHTTQPQGQSESPLPVATEALSQNVASTMETTAAPSTSTSPAPEVATSYPIEPSLPIEHSNPAPDAPTQSPVETSEHTVSITPSPDQSPGRFSGKRYSEISGNGQWPSKDEWLSNGGTLDNFYA